MYVTSNFIMSDMTLVSNIRELLLIKILYVKDTIITYILITYNNVQLFYFVDSVFRFFFRHSPLTR